MTSEELFDRLKRNFRPTRIFTSDGKVHDIRHWLLTLVTDTIIDIGRQAEGCSPGIGEHFEIYDLDEVVRVEDLPESADVVGTTR